MTRYQYDITVKGHWTVKEMTMQKRIAPFGATNQQKEWLDNESKRTGNSQATVMRKLIQKEIDKEQSK